MMMVAALGSKYLKALALSAFFVKLELCVLNISTMAATHYAIDWPANCKVDKSLDPCKSIMDMIDRSVPTELIYMTIEYEYGFNHICTTHSQLAHKTQTILDELLLNLEAYHEFDDIDDKFYDLADLVLMLVRSNAKCARDLTHADIIDLRDDHDEINLLAPVDGVDSFEYIFKCLSMDVQRFRYLYILKFYHPEYLCQHLDKYIDIILTNRNYCDEFNPVLIIQRYDEIFGIDSTCIDGLSLMQALTQKKLSFMYQVTELYELYKRICALISAAQLLIRSRQTL